MKIAPLRSWAPAIVLCVVAADLNFWIYASIGTNEGDALGIAFFLLSAIDSVFALASGPDPARVVALIGALLATALMALRELEVFDPGWLPPYAVAMAFLVGGAVISRKRRS